MNCAALSVHSPVDPARASGPTFDRNLYSPQYSNAGSNARTSNQIYDQPTKFGSLGAQVPAASPFNQNNLYPSFNAFPPQFGAPHFGAPNPQFNPPPSYQHPMYNQNQLQNYQYVQPNFNSPYGHYQMPMNIPAGMLPNAAPQHFPANAAPQQFAANAQPDRVAYFRKSGETDKKPPQ